MTIVNDNAFNERHEEYNKIVEPFPILSKNLPLTQYLCENGFFSAPASTKYHGAYPGGLFDHSKAVTDRLVWMTYMLELKWQRKESPIIVGLFHDLCKIDQYKAVIGPTILNEHDNGVKEYGTGIQSYEYNNDLILKGHGDKSIMLLSQFITLTEEEMLCIRYHMGAYMTEEWSQFDLAAKKFESVLWTHQADQLASKIDGM